MSGRHHHVRPTISLGEQLAWTLAFVVVVLVTLASANLIGGWLQ